MHFLKKVGNSACGPDGIPFEGWKRSGNAGARTLYLIGTDHLDGTPSPPCFNHSLSAFIGKGEEEGDGNSLS